MLKPLPRKILSDSVIGLSCGSMARPSRCARPACRSAINELLNPELTLSGLRDGFLGLSDKGLCQHDNCSVTIEHRASHPIPHRAQFLPMPSRVSAEPSASKERPSDLESIDRAPRQSGDLHRLANAQQSHGSPSRA